MQDVMLRQLAAASLRVVEAFQRPELFILLDDLVSFKDGCLGHGDLTAFLLQAIAVVRSLSAEDSCSLIKHLREECNNVKAQYRELSADNTTRETHLNIKCDQCGVQSIVGRRYKSLVRDSCNLCGQCFGSCARNPGHWVRVKQQNDVPSLNHGTSECVLHEDHAKKTWKSTRRHGNRGSCGWTLPPDGCRYFSTRSCRYGMSRYCG
jgi:hypothetical protein